METGDIQLTMQEAWIFKVNAANSQFWDLLIQKSKTKRNKIFFKMELEKGTVHLNKTYNLMNKVIILLSICSHIILSKQFIDFMVLQNAEFSKVFMKIILH